MRSSAHNNRLLNANFADFVAFEVLGERSRKARKRLADGQYIGSDSNAKERADHGEAKHHAKLISKRGLGAFKLNICCGRRSAPTTS
jgi:hypothetical protein